MSREIFEKFHQVVEDSDSRVAIRCPSSIDDFFDDLIKPYDDRMKEAIDAYCDANDDLVNTSGPIIRERMLVQGFDSSQLSSKESMLTELLPAYRTPMLWYMRAIASAIRLSRTQLHQALRPVDLKKIVAREHVKVNSLSLLSMEKFRPLENVTITGSPIEDAPLGRLFHPNDDRFHWLSRDPYTREIFGLEIRKLAFERVQFEPFYGVVGCSGRVDSMTKMQEFMDKLVETKIAPVLSRLDQIAAKEMLQKQRSV